MGVVTKTRPWTLEDLERLATDDGHWMPAGASEPLSPDLSAE